MGFGGYGGSGSGRGPGRPRRRNQLSQRTIILIGVGLVLFAVLIRTNRINRFEIIYFCVLIPSIILHEISHGVVALAFGDDTAKRSGRLSLNPVKHIDPVGTLIVPAVLSLTGIGAYGWAKPVPVSTNRLRHPRNETVLVSLVGPTTNYLLAAVAGVVFVVTTPLVVRQIVSQGYFPPTLFEQVVYLFGFANIVLGTFNLIPCPPLDGAALLERFIPARSLPEYYRLQPLLMFLPFILILLFRNQWAELIGHLINWWSSLLV